ncbi:MAG: translation factor (SUA5), partial [Lachnospiraceae bacterium]|nr:translation factor (SUA5) [Lachnospiraceae bacterium]
GKVLSIGARNDERTIAKRLYDILRSFDELDVDKIYSESFISPGLGQAIMNRLLKAAGHRVLEAKQEKNMREYHRIIFIEDDGTCRAPMAAGILEEQVLNHPIEIFSRGLVVLFPEPLNQKAEAVMISNGLKTEGFMSVQLQKEDITDDTLLLTMSEENREKLMELFPDLIQENVEVLTKLVGDELEILDPYGGNLQAYGICYETLNKSIKKLVKLLNEGDKICQK